MCAACARLHNGIIDYLLTSHNNSAVYLIIGAFQSPTPTRSSPISLTLFESDNRLVAWVDEAEQRLSILCGVRAALPRRIREREFSVREERGNRDFFLSNCSSHLPRGQTPRRLHCGEGGAGEILQLFKACPSHETKSGEAQKRRRDACGAAGASAAGRGRKSLALPRGGADDTFPTPIHQGGLGPFTRAPLPRR